VQTMAPPLGDSWRASIVTPVEDFPASTREGRRRATGVER
jgi:hypothetical protein